MEQRKYDVIVIGSGAAGMMAALTVAAAGKTCLVMEKGESLTTSNSARAGGPALAGTKVQTAEGESLTPEQLYQHMFNFSRATVNPALLRAALAEGPAVEAWLEKAGIKLFLTEDGYGVGYRARHMLMAPPQQRWEAVLKLLESLGGELTLGTEALRLLQDERGAVTGVCARKDGQEVTYAASAVVIATGGYLGSDEEMQKRFSGVAVNALGNKLSDGGGMRMATGVGAVLDRNWGIAANEFGGYNRKHEGQTSWLRYAVMGGLFVDARGERFMNEQLMVDRPLSLGGEQTIRVGKYYAVLDAAMVEALETQSLYDYCGRPANWNAGKLPQNSSLPRKFGAEPALEELISEGWIIKADSLEEAAAAFGLTHLPESVAAYNAACAAGVDTQFGKEAFLLHPLTTAPYYVVEYEPSAWSAFGGVKTDGACRALNAAQQVIPGLYIAGLDNGSAFCSPYYENEGAALGIAFTTGILAGKTILTDQE